MLQFWPILVLSLSAIAGISDNLRLNVVYGDNKTQFELSNASTGAILKYQSYNQNSKTINVSPKDYKFVSAQASEILKLESDKRTCLRNFIELIATANGQQVKRFACIGSEIPISRKMTNLANTMDIQVF